MQVFQIAKMTYLLYFKGQIICCTKATQPPGGDQLVMSVYLSLVSTEVIIIYILHNAGYGV